MLISRHADGLQFHDQTAFDEEIRKVFAENRSIFVINRERVLLLDLHHVRFRAYQSLLW